MDIWLSDDRPSHGPTSHSLRKGKKKEEIPWSYPLAEAGSLTAAGLHDKNGRLEWTFPLRELERGLRIKGTSKEIYLPTCPLPIRLPETSIQHRAEQGANFIRTYFPDVDIPAELLREEIVADMQASRKLDEFDPCMGDTLEVVGCYDGRKHGLALAFPMGESKRDLNLSPFSYEQDSGAVFKPSANAVKTFGTPIMQITSSSSDSGTVGKSLLAVRTYASTTLLEVKAKISGVHSQSVLSLDALTLGVVNHSDLGSRQIVDMALRLTPDPQLLFVNDQGATYTCRVGGGKNTVSVMHPGTDDQGVGSEDPFRGIILAKDAEWFMLSSSKVIGRSDFCSSSRPSPFFSIQDEARSVITHVGAPRPDHLFCVTTTEDVLWIDDRFARKPVLGYKHKREPDRSLFSMTTSTLSRPLTLLASKRNNLITVYDVSREGDDSLVYSNASPYSPRAAGPWAAPYAGSKLFAHPLQNDIQDISFARLSHRGSLHCMDFRLSSGGAEEYDAGDMMNTKVEWSDEICGLDDEGLRPDVGPLGGREFAQVDLWPAYERLFIAPRRQQAEKDPEAVYDLLEKMPAFKQNLDEPVDSALTMFDIAFRSGEEPAQSSRADFITQSALNSTRGYRALVQNRIPKTQLVQEMPWHTSIKPFLRHFDEDAAKDPEELLEALRCYDLESTPDRPGPSYRLEAEAREQLTLDLALASDVFSLNPFRIPHTEDVDDALETMSRATESMSISVPEPPPVQFGYLRPVMKSKMDYYSKEEQPKGPDTQEVELPLGARLLMQEWEVGEDPNDYVYRDPYDAAPPPMKAATQKRTQPGALDVLSRSQPDLQRPPLIVPARTLAPSIPAIQAAPRRAPAHSQEFARPGRMGAASQPTVPESQSQDIFMANTQVLPGPFGGRLPAVKKKVAKKRMGGF
ncbi:hypothetical protein OE88DRAFT_1732355 [Heliocybe sulcata]|uniref:Uncharacterized protein n=1 Tax=Heliocybe sulcata TaxID=5364 RepID=A0A5C3NCN3_9AGAM|nr:hypothetical protein OE88DRAFT_1732355 [Heliocybe sulcata]